MPDESQFATLYLRPVHHNEQSKAVKFSSTEIVRAAFPDAYIPQDSDGLVNFIGGYWQPLNDYRGDERHASQSNPSVDLPESRLSFGMLMVAFKYRQDIVILRQWKFPASVRLWAGETLFTPGGNIIESSGGLPRRVFWRGKGHYLELMSMTLPAEEMYGVFDELLSHSSR